MNFESFHEQVLKTYNRMPVFFEKGKECWLYDKKGNRWLDFISGIGVNNLGHCHPILVKALKKQAKKLWHTSNLYFIEPQGKLAEKISDLSFPGKTFFCNSGAEANEAAIKLCRKWGNSIHPEKNILLSLKQSFHGRTLAAITLTGQEIYQKGFEPLPPAMEYLDANDLEGLKAKMNSRVAGVFLEPIQGEGGILPLTKEFVQLARELCTKNQAILVMDEVQTGIGRTGKVFAYEHHGIEPDVITLAKALSNGVPVGALHVKNEFAVLGPGEHASTFGGNFLACSVGIKVLEIISHPDFLNRLQKKSQELEKGLKKLREEFPQWVEQVRGIGMMWGIVTPQAAEIYQKLFERKILTTNVKNKVIRILPPLVSGSKEIQWFLKNLREVLQTF